MLPEWFAVVGTAGLGIIYVVCGTLLTVYTWSAKRRGNVSLIEKVADTALAIIIMMMGASILINLVQSLMGNR